MLPYQQKQIHKDRIAESEAVFDFVTNVEKKKGNSVEE